MVVTVIAEPESDARDVDISGAYEVAFFEAPRISSQMSDQAPVIFL